VFEDIVHQRKSFFRLFLLSAFAGYLGKSILKMSNVWIYTGFIPLALLYIHDMKNVPYDEIENFYKYSLEIKKTKAYYEVSKKTVNDELANIDKDFMEKIKEDLNKTNKTLFEVMSGLDNEMLKFTEI
jgi:tRNA(Ile)-lysidine synthase TilS/MesJ